MVRAKEGVVLPAHEEGHVVESEREREREGGRGCHHRRGAASTRGGTYCIERERWPCIRPVERETQMPKQSQLVWPLAQKCQNGADDHGPGTNMPRLSRRSRHLSKGHPWMNFPSSQKHTSALCPLLHASIFIRKTPKKTQRHIWFWSTHISPPFKCGKLRLFSILLTRGATKSSTWQGSTRCFETQ